MREVYEQTMFLPFAICFPWELHRDVRKYVTNLVVGFLFARLRTYLFSLMSLPSAKRKEERAA